MGPLCAGFRAATSGSYDRNHTFARLEVRLLQTPIGKSLAVPPLRTNPDFPVFADDIRVSILHVLPEVDVGDCTFKKKSPFAMVDADNDIDTFERRRHAAFAQHRHRPSAVGTCRRLEHPGARSTPTPQDHRQQECDGTFKNLPLHAASHAAPVPGISVRAMGSSIGATGLTPTDFEILFI